MRRTQESPPTAPTTRRALGGSLPSSPMGGGIVAKPRDRGPGRGDQGQIARRFAHSQSSYAMSEADDPRQFGDSGVVSEKPSLPHVAADIHCRNAKRSGVEVAPDADALQKAAFAGLMA